MSTKVTKSPNLGGYHIQTSDQEIPGQVLVIFGYPGPELTRASPGLLWLPWTRADHGKSWLTLVDVDQSNQITKSGGVPYPDLRPGPINRVKSNQKILKSCSTGVQSLYMCTVHGQLYRMWIWYPPPRFGDSISISPRYLYARLG